LGYSLLAMGYPVRISDSQQGDRQPKPLANSE
jgi:hypothetical protein